LAVERPCYPQSAVAQRLRVGRSTIYHLLAHGAPLRVVHIGRSIRIKASSADVYIEHLAATKSRRMMAKRSARPNRPDASGPHVGTRQPIASSPSTPTTHVPLRGISSLAIIDCLLSYLISARSWSRMLSISALLSTNTLSDEMSPGNA